MPHHAWPLRTSRRGVITEFTNVEGLWRGSDRIYRDFLYTLAERPAVAQIFGCRPEYFYKAAHVVCELGFDGLDIKKGVPQFQAGQYGSRSVVWCLSSTRLHSDRKKYGILEEFERGCELRVV